MTKKVRQSCDDTHSPQKYKNKPLQKCRYCSTINKPCRCLEFDKECKKCGCINHFERDHRSNSRLAPKETGSEWHREVHDTC